MANGTAGACFGALMTIVWLSDGYDDNGKPTANKRQMNGRQGFQQISKNE
jgi:hypothetical protein